MRWNCRRTPTASQPRYRRSPIPAPSAQFIPAGARILDLGASSASRTLVPNGCSYVGASKKRRTRDIGLNTEKFPTEVAMQAELIVMLGVLERVKDIESSSLSIEMPFRYKTRVH